MNKQNNNLNNLRKSGKYEGPWRVRGVNGRDTDKSTTLEVVNIETGHVLWTGIYYQANYFQEILNLAHEEGKKEAFGSAIGLLEKTRERIEDEKIVPHVLDVVVDADKNETIADKLIAGKESEVNELVETL